MNRIFDLRMFRWFDGVLTEEACRLKCQLKGTHFLRVVIGVYVQKLVTFISQIFGEGVYHVIKNPRYIIIYPGVRADNVLLLSGRQIQTISLQRAVDKEADAASINSLLTFADCKFSFLGSMEPSEKLPQNLRTRRRM